jgi:hypothetical protein
MTLSSCGSAASDTRSVRRSNREQRSLGDTNTLARAQLQPPSSPLAGKEKNRLQPGGKLEPHFTLRKECRVGGRSGTILM